MNLEERFRILRQHNRAAAHTSLFDFTQHRITTGITYYKFSDRSFRLTQSKHNTSSPYPWRTHQSQSFHRSNQQQQQR